MKILPVVLRNYSFALHMIHLNYTLTRSNLREYSLVSINWMLWSFLWWHIIEVVFFLVGHTDGDIDWNLYGRLSSQIKKNDIFSLPWIMDTYRGCDNCNSFIPYLIINFFSVSYESVSFSPLWCLLNYFTLVYI